MAGAETALAASALPLTVTDTRAQNGSITVETGEWRLVFSDRFNGGPAGWYDLAFPGGATDNLATASAGGFYSNGVLFDYDVYLGTSGANAIEFMTTQGTNATPGALEFELLETTPARVQILQRGHPRLNNGQGPPGDPFPELALVRTTTVWTLYATGRVHIDFAAELNPAGQTVDSGPGGAGKGIDAAGCCGLEAVVDASNGANFHTAMVWAGDSIESAAGGWGPIRIAARQSATRLLLDAPVPAGQDLDYVIRRENIVMETLSIHADGDPGLVAQCSDPATSRWQGGSNGDVIWTEPSPGDPCKTKLRTASPPIGGDFVLAHWTRTRGAGSLLAYFEPWAGFNFGAFNDEGFTDISYTQHGRFGIRPFAPHARHFMAQLGSSAATTLPTLKSVADALPFALDYRAPWAAALVGSLASGGAITAHGFDLRTGAYEIAATGDVAVIRFDASGGARAALAYQAPAVLVSGLSPSVGELEVAISTDGGASFALLASARFNLTGPQHAASLGAGKRLFQLLEEIPSSASGASAIAFRFTRAPPAVTALAPPALALTAAALLLAARLAPLRESMPRASERR